MSREVSFEAGLYRGTAEFYDRFRLPYPDAMTADLVRRAAPSGHGCLLDLACGTGQLTFPLLGRFTEVWAVDAEPDMTQLVRAKAVAADAPGIRAVTAEAEELRAEASAFELIVIGNAFHRLDRALVARRAYTWLEPGGHLALCWSNSPWVCDQDWQRALDALLRTWQTRLDAATRVPAGWNRPRRETPDHQVLAQAGFELAGRHEFSVDHHWTIPELAGHIRSTSFLPPPVLAEHATAFDTTLTAELSRHSPLTETVGFAYDLFRKPTAEAAHE
ncbi:bifunctional 2-polyprenyl-6-hydroxyphenol methylase/3-demethylubiquinol 3-O-methyltransferase UbiG [Streptomyces griseus]|uniref:class I SAM-dependent methyltransferase n=1 Tax=Streptomyces griseus TaxID=1911 RepID=UPI0005621CB8|nr:class I SAM-dependent methyltransferase [Streptomyces griseus]